MSASKVTQGQKNYKYGLWAEYLAVAVLWMKNYRILACRYKRPVGEIDIVARKNNSLIFVEVKWRKSKESADYAITPAMKKRIVKAAQFYCMENNIAPDAMSMQFDAVLVSKPFRVRHLVNIFGINDN